MNIHLILLIALVIWTVYSYIKSVKLPVLKGKHFIIYLPGIIILALQMLYHGVIGYDDLPQKNNSK